MKKIILKILIIVIFFSRILNIPVTLADAIPPMFNDFSANPISVKFGESTEIKWSSSGATYCTANGDWSGVQNTTGSLTITPYNAINTYKMHCSTYDDVTNTTAKSAEKTVIVNVNIPPTPVCVSPQILINNQCVTSTPTTYVSNTPKSNLFIRTDEATNFTQDSAILHGTGGDLITNPTLPITAYFRYSTADISPIFCNDIYGTNMNATKDLNLGITSSSSFKQSIGNLKPNTKYYYCAIISNKENISYGGSSIVKSFYTSPLRTTITTNNAIHITSVSAVLNGTYSSTKNVNTYFKYSEVPSSSGTSPVWKEIGKQTHSIGSNSSLHGNISFTLSGLKPLTKYMFTAVAEDSEITNGATLEFTTISTSVETGTGTGTTCTYPYVLNTTTKTCVNTKTCTSPLILDVQTNNCINPTLQTCTLPYVLNNITNACVLPKITCTSPLVLEQITNNCIMPESLTCTSPLVYDLQKNICVNLTSCTLPYVLNTSNNSCIKPTTCTLPYVLNSSTNSCAIPPTETFCEKNPTDSSCLPGPGWSWNGTGWSGNWNGGSWSGGSWTGGTWSGGVWSGNNGTWSGGTWTNGKWTGGVWNPTLTIGQTATPPADAIVRYHEGIETVFVRQIIANKEFAKTYGYQEGDNIETFAWGLADSFARAFGYISDTGKEIRVSQPDVAAYQLQLVGNKLTVYEYYDGKIVDIRNVTTVFKNPSGYEYYFKK